MFGVNGRLLALDMSARKISERSISDSLWREYLGGSGLASMLLYRESDPWVDPLAPENPLLMIAGLLTGTPVLTSCKVSVCSKSPLTGIWGESTVGGYWGQQLKAAGYDGIVLNGRASEPVYIWLHDGKVEIVSATDLWGKETYETSEILKNRTDPKAEVACIGPAGENLVEIASIIFGGHDSRAAGRCGMGAVMGSKNVKAVVVRGTARPPIAHPKELAGSAKTTLGILKECAKGLADYGTAGGMSATEATGDLPIKNWTGGSWADGAAKISGQAQAEEILVSHYGCWACPIRCGKTVEVKIGPRAGSIAHGPEYETCAGFGSMMDIDNMHYIAAANDLCNRLGLDTISTSSVIAMATELRERGAWLPEKEGGPVLRWGDGESVLDVIPLIAARQGLGEVLCHGVRALGNRLGGLARELAVECKGLEVAYHDPRAFTSMAGNYATANRGGCHLEGLTYYIESGALAGSAIGFDRVSEIRDPKWKGEIAARMQDFMEVFNALGICKFLMRGKVTPEVMQEWVGFTTGWTPSAVELLSLGEKIHNLKRMYNVRLGVSRKDDTLPPRLLTHDRKTGRAAGNLPHLGRILSDYYTFREWSEEGIPTNEKLQALGLGWLADEVAGVSHCRLSR